MAEASNRAPIVAHRWTIPAVAAFLASAGLPLYIQLPRYAAELGIGLGTIGGLLLGLRALDFVQDPFLGHLIDRFPGRRGLFAGLAFGGMALGFLAVFVLQPGLWGLAAGLVLTFTAYSLGSILFYGQGAELVGAGEEAQHLELSGRREAGSLAGVVLAAVAPGVLGAALGLRGGYMVFGLLLAGFAGLVWRFSRSFWVKVPPRMQAQGSFRQFLQPGILGLLVLAVVNALPVAVTSTLFLFFVGDLLHLPDLAGLFLVLFFVAAGVSAPVWSGLAARFGARRVLMLAMVLAILGFVGVASLGPGAALAFGAISVMSGLATGADMVILPALFSRALVARGVPSGVAFGVWSFAGKLSLALAAAVVLPVLQVFGFAPGGQNTAQALQVLMLAYAVVPCLLKLGALAMVARLRLDPAAGLAPAV
ncbi:sodium:galactoside symporter [bacterium]|nr:sodium:galactoside symporter [bacterium]